jgi:ribosomal protein S27AE
MKTSVLVPFVSRESLVASISRACVNCGAPGVKQEVSKDCPNCGMPRPPDEYLGEIWAREITFWQMLREYLRRVIATQWRKLWT